MTEAEALDKLKRDIKEYFGKHPLTAKEREVLDSMYAEQGKCKTIPCGDGSCPFDRLQAELTNNSGCYLLFEQFYPSFAPDDSLLVKFVRESCTRWTQEDV